MGTKEPTKMSAIVFRERWLAEMERSKWNPDFESKSDYYERVDRIRRNIRAELETLRALPDDATPEQVRASMGISPDGRCR